MANENSRRFGMLIDAGTCAGCFTCVYSCKLQNATPTDTFWCKLSKSEKGSYPDAKMIVLPHGCMHCQDAPCVNNCPTGASAHNKDGLVMVDYDKCIGCETCIKSCPYGARTLNRSITKPYYQGAEPTPYEQIRSGEHHENVVDKCIMCYGRTGEGDGNAVPSCVASCPAQCRWYGDLNDPESEISLKITEMAAKPLFENLGTEPSIYYVGVDDADWENIVTAS